MYLSIGALPVSIGLIAGDFVSCLRGALDHLATKLTMARGGTYNDRASFPVLSVLDAETSRSFDRGVKGIPVEAIEVIRSLQPYHSGKLYKASKLWQLHRHWNIDKHRRIPLHATGGELRIRHPSHMQPVSSGTDYGGVMRFPLAAKGKVYFNPAVKIIVEFGDKHEVVIVRADELVDIHNFVTNDVLPRFTRFF